MNIESEQLKSILLDGNYLSEDELDGAIESAKGSDLSFGSYLLSKDMITKDLLGQAIAEEYDVTYFDLNSRQPTAEQVRKIPEDIAREVVAVVAEEGKDAVRVATANPEPEKIREKLADVFPEKEIEVAYSLAEDIKNLFVYYQEPLDTRFADIIEESEAVAPDILNEIFDDAFMFEASDIHFEPHEKEVLVRFRVDGVLQEAGRIPKKYYENILNRVKVLSNLRIDEHFIAQDGSMQYTAEDRSYDVRTSIAPTVAGEKVVLRILASYIGDLNLSNLGLTPKNKEILKDAAHQPFGMILVSGPTGSGKTTTLYSLLRLLDTPEVNITTIEDPVEYKISGANQIQVNKEKDLDFATGLRSIVRQDPDIILVGEVRDQETADISVNAALTGHLLFSTFHSNDAATAIPRLLDMGVEPFLLASTLEVIVAQRLVRKICESCRHSVTTSVNELEDVVAGAGQFFDDEEVTVYEGDGCEVCNHKGYDGRTAVFEIIEVTSEMEALILENPSTQEVWKLAREQGTESMFEDGIKKVQSGITTLSEVARVTPSDDVRKEDDE